MYTKTILTVITGLLITVSCQTKDSKEGKSKEMNTKQQVNSREESSTENTPLASLLNVRREEFTKAAPEEVKKAYAEGIDAVKNSGILEKALNIGDKVPDFTLNNQMSKPVTLYNELKKGPVILVWYRGGWCPYCNITLHNLQERLPDFQKAGASLIALTPEIPDQSLNTTEKHSLEFTVLSDVANKVAKEYGVVFKLTPEVAALYQKAFDMHSYNGDESDELPLAATYVIDQKGIIQYAFLDADYRNRAEPNDVIAALAKLNAGN
ncbi:peroxiredoxin-like family protein [Labilibaculum antarcticum]|uniref:thioredoxin-dependent peroxiredoxin n=1 Tax=Labilibaculum antarcticum TaxID=1717717 RepID=A0A1Y1CEF3_9BACT|nr:peroxiredoxin-like family protein [Labilibaculum antarcticum]BAX78705.1 peroxiredoxin [Labilibaculum antarcticum]